MVKICPKCGEKNFDDAKYCMHCNTNIKKVEKLPNKPLISKDDEYSYYKPRGYQSNSYIWRPFAYLGIFFAVLSFFIGGLLFVFIAFMLGGIAVARGEILGLIAIIIAIIPVILIFVI